MKKHFATFIVIFFAVTCFGQVTNEKRIEIELRNGLSNEQIFTFGNKGIVMLCSADNVDGNERYWVYSIFNTDLELIKSDTISVGVLLKYEETYTNDGHIYTFFKSLRGNYSIVSLDIESFEISQLNGKLPKRCYIKDMAVYDNNAYFFCAISRKPHFYSINLKTGQDKAIPVSVTNDLPIEIIDFQLLEETKEVIIYVDAYLSRKEKNTYVVKYDMDGEKNDCFNLSGDISENIISISALNLAQDEYIFIGTYSITDRYRSEGIFLCKTQNNEISFFNFAKFTELDNFMSFFTEKSVKKFEKKKKIIEKYVKGYNAKFNIVPHDIITRPDGYILIGEIFYPTYKEVRSTLSPDKIETVFDGFTYTHAIIAKFSIKGDIIWEHTFKLISFKKYMKIKELITVDEHDENLIKLLYVNNGYIRSKSIDNDGNIIEDMELASIDSDTKGDNIKFSDNFIDYWYDKYYLVYGSQVIKNKENKDIDKKRRIYCLSKISYN